MAQEIFVDAGFWIALFYPPDEHHAQTRIIWRDVVREQWPIVTTNWTLYEAITFFNSRWHRHDMSVQALDLVSQLSEVVHVEEAQLESRSLEIFRQHSDKSWSVVDCANFASIERRQCEYALSYDRDFEQAQFEFSFQLFKP